MKSFFLIFSLFISILTTAQAQNGIIKHFGVEDGLASNHVYAAFQDSKGYIWFATTNGVSRFDGKEFKNYTSNNKLPDNDIFDIAEDALGRIWLSCYNGEPCYLYEDEFFTSSNDSSLKKIPKAGYFRFYHRGKKLILTKSLGNTNFEINDSGNLIEIPVSGTYFLEFKNHLLRLATSSKIPSNFKCYLYDNSYKKMDSLLFTRGVLEYGKTVHVKDVFSSVGNSFIVLLNNGDCLLYTFRNNKIVFLKKLNKDPAITGTYYHGNKLWINKSNAGIVPVTDDLNKDTSRDTLFRHIAVQNFMIDREGNYWACTFGKGLYMIPNNNFSYYSTSTDPEQNDILKLGADFKHNEIYLGCANVVLKYTGGNKPLRNLIRPFTPTLKGKIVDLYNDSLNLVIATNNEILVMNKATKRFEKKSINNIKCITKGKNQTVLFGTHSGCSQLVFPDSLTTILSGRTVALHQRKNGDILIGTLTGIVTAKKNKQGIWKTEPVKHPTLLKKTRISCIKEIGNVIVAGTVQKGLILIDGEDYELVNLGNGLNDINCKSLFIDGKTIWLASFSGVFKITLKSSIHSYSVENIRKFNGLLSDDVNDILVIRDTVYVAGSNGLTSFFTKKIDRRNHDHPDVYINDLIVNGLSLRYRKDKIHLPQDSNTIDLHFSAIDFKSMGNILFKYRLTGIHKKWQYTKDNFVRFESLPPGDYTFELLAMNAENVWSLTPVTLFISISPSWWQTSWFYIALIILLTIIIYFGVRRSFIKKHHKQMREHSLKRHVTELELRAIKAQINPHFIFNTLNAIQYFISINENEKAESYINRMAVLLRQTLDFSDRTTVSVTEEINYLENYLELEKLRFDENFIFTITNKLTKDQDTIEIPPMVLQPHVENALRHGFKNMYNEIKKIDITFKLENGQLICEVLDNGIGRVAAASNYKNETKYSSRGMELSHSKLLMYESITGKKIKTDIEDKYLENNRTAAGTLIRIIINQ